LRLRELAQIVVVIGVSDLRTRVMEPRDFRCRSCRLDGLALGGADRSKDIGS
jgi:hypothetical protein